MGRAATSTVNHETPPAWSTFNTGNVLVIHTHKQYSTQSLNLFCSKQKHNRELFYTKRFSHGKVYSAVYALCNGTFVQSVTPLL